MLAMEQVGLLVAVSFMDTMERDKLEWQMKAKVEAAKKRMEEEMKVVHFKGTNRKEKVLMENKEEASSGEVLLVEDDEEIQVCYDGIEVSKNKKLENIRNFLFSDKGDFQTENDETNKSDVKSKTTTTLNSTYKNDKVELKVKAARRGERLSRSCEFCEASIEGRGPLWRRNLGRHMEREHRDRMKELATVCAPAANTANIPAENMANMASACMANIPAENMANIPAKNMANITSTNMANIPVETMANIPSANIANIPAGNTANIPSANMANILAANTANIPVEQSDCNKTVEENMEEMFEGTIEESCENKTNADKEDQVEVNERESETKVASDEVLEMQRPDKRSVISEWPKPATPTLLFSTLV